MGVVGADSRRRTAHRHQTLRGCRTVPSASRGLFAERHGANPRKPRDRWQPKQAVDTPASPLGHRPRREVSHRFPVHRKVFSVVRNDVPEVNHRVSDLSDLFPDVSHAGPEVRNPFSDLRKTVSGVRKMNPEVRPGFSEVRKTVPEHIKRLPDQPPGSGDAAKRPYLPTFPVRHPTGAASCLLRNLLAPIPAGWHSRQRGSRQ